MEEIDYVRSPHPDPALFLRGYHKLPSVLRRLGFDSLREGQDRAVKAVLGGVDTFCVMPTSGGKSAVFIVPALAQEWATVVFCPLKALMRDQVVKLQEKGVRARAVYSGKDMDNAMALSEWASGECELLYVAPERIENDAFKSAMRARAPEMVVVDEVHTAAQWADTFRHAFMNIAKFIRLHDPKVVVATTATFSEDVETEVRRVLQMPDATKIAHYPIRANLHLSSSEWVDDYSVADKIKEIDGKVLIYCGTRKNTERMAQFLSRALRQTVLFYHGTLADAKRQEYQGYFTKGSVQYLCATNAFGLGIDIPDIRGVIHAYHPSDPEGLDQECGRAGRDGKDSFCHTFQSKQAENFCWNKVRNNHPPKDFYVRIYNLLQSRASNGSVTISNADIAIETGIYGDSVDAIIQTFFGSGVVRKGEAPPRVHSVRMGTVAGSGLHFDVFEKFLDDSAELHKGAWLFDLDSLANVMQREPETARKYLKTWHDNKFIEWSAPKAGRTLVMAGDLNKVDFGRLMEKKAAATAKMNYVMRYFEIPDPDKREYLRDYFIKNYVTK